MQRFFDRRTLLLFLILIYLGPIRSIMNGGAAGLGDWIVNTLITIPGIIVGLSFHEYAHAMVAYKCGDVTPKVMGRCTVEPQAHVDLFGILSLLFIGFGWGKPVVVNPANFRNRRRDSILVGVAGVTMNLIVALVFGLILKIVVMAVPQVVMTDFGFTVFRMLYNVITINISLMLFNLLPVPPLDGFNVVTEVFRLENTQFHHFVYRNSMVILLVLIILDVPHMLLTRPLYAIVNFITTTIFHIF
ncbi:MAG: site-2 protease family protein [Firmicutes bacterium]|nr:site-2 protease family protein [Bacillota bacterium]